MRQPSGTSKRQVAKTLGSAKPPVAKTTRQTLHLGEQVVERLGVHCSLTHRDRSSVANEILLTWLARYGKGREIFDSPEEGRDPAGVDHDDRLEPATLETNSAVANL
jgi:hypothetical protein